MFFLVAAALLEGKWKKWCVIVKSGGCLRTRQLCIMHSCQACCRPAEGLGQNLPVCIASAVWHTPELWLKPLILKHGRFAVAAQHVLLGRDHGMGICGACGHTAPAWAVKIRRQKSSPSGLAPPDSLAGDWAAFQHVPL
jgi:hypothetical protein